MTTHVLDHNPLTGETCLFHDNQDGTFDIQHIQARSVIDALLDGNKEMANDTALTRRGIKQDWWKYATIPNVLIMKWKQELGVDIFNKDHRKKMFQLINSPEYKFLKTTSATHAPKN